MSTLAWPDVAWGSYVYPGSTSAGDYRSAFLRCGSGEASLSEENARLNRLEGRAPNWDGRGSGSPSQRAVEEAREWLKGIYRAGTRTSKPWLTPHISMTDCGEVVFEWWRGERKITLYFGGNAVEYFKVWGPNIDSEMESGELKKADAFRELWQWLGA